MSDYREALQNPKLAFKSADLQTADVKKSPLGLPLLVSGGFALTACLTANNNGRSSKFAVRCFHKEVPDLQERYSYISKFLQTCTDEFFVNFVYEPEGIKVHGKWYPIVRMTWVEGVSLPEYIDANISNSIKLKALAEQIKKVGTRLGQLKVAHGDLQHGNIIIRPNGNPVLIDYDGTYVQGMPFKSSNEAGHSSYQHPARNSLFFNDKVDNFSLIVIYTSLLILASPQGPQLWKKYRDSEKLIFGRDDYKSPQNSQIFSELINDLQIGSLVEKLQYLCLCPIELLPTLDQFINSNYSLPSISNKPAVETDEYYTASTASTVVIQGQQDSIEALNLIALINQEGNNITVVGRILNTKTISTFNGNITFINFGSLQNVKYINKDKYNPFSIVVFSQGIEAWDRSKNFPIDNLKNSYVQITGLLELYKRNDGSITPQIILSDPFQLKVIIAVTSPVSSKKPIPLERITPSQVNAPSKPKPPASTTAASSSPISPLPQKPIPQKPVPPRRSSATSSSLTASSSSPHSSASLSQSRVSSSSPSSSSSSPQSIQPPTGSEPGIPVSSTNQQGTSSNEQKSGGEIRAGAAMGALTGGAIGGPVGAVVGGTAGAVVGALLKFLKKTNS